MIGVRERASVNTADFAVVLEMLDRVYDAVATDRLQTISDIDQRVIAGWLEDIQHTTHEILQELELR